MLPASEIEEVVQPFLPGVEDLVLAQTFTPFPTTLA